MLQWGGGGGQRPLHEHLPDPGLSDPGALRTPALSYPNEQWGYGTVQLMQSFHLMREL